MNLKIADMIYGTEITNITCIEESILNQKYTTSVLEVELVVPLPRGFRPRRQFRNLLVIGRYLWKLTFGLVKLEEKKLAEQTRPSIVGSGSM